MFFGFADLCFAFSSPAAKMPRISSSGDDTIVEKTVPSTTVSSPEDDIRGILAAELEKQNTNQQTKKQKYSIPK